MSTAYLGLGSNIDAETNIRSGINELRQLFRHVSLSPAYRSPAVGFEGNDFINLVARVDTDMQPLELKRVLHELEDRHGRDRSSPKYSDRTLDIDILLYDDLCLVSPELEIPRREILTCAHVLKPLADLAPALMYPGEHRSISELWDTFAGPRGALTRVTL